MTAPAYTYLLYGLLLVGVFAVIIAYYYARKRHTEVESPKYRMLEDDEQA